MTTLSTYTDLTAAGVPANSNYAARIAAAVSDQAAVAGVFDDLAAMNDLLEEAAGGHITWIDSTTEPGGFPVRFLMETSGTESNTVVMTLFPLTEVIEGHKTPETFSESTGGSYYHVASVEFTARTADEIVYMVMMRVGVPASTDPAEFPSVDWDATLLPVLDNLTATLNELYAPASAPQTGAVERTARTKARTEPLDVIGPAVSVAMLVIKVIKMVVTIIEHPSALQTMVFNFGPQPVTFGSAYLYDTGEVQYADTLGRSMTGLEGYTLPAPLPVHTGDGTMRSLVQLAYVSQVSAKELQGVGLALISQSGDGDAAALINVPWCSDNRINAQSDYAENAESYWNDQHDDLMGPPATADLGTTLRAGLNIDALSGKQPDGDGYMAYFYRALLVFQGR